MPVAVRISVFTLNAEPFFRDDSVNIIPPSNTIVTIPDSLDQVIKKDNLDFACFWWENRGLASVSFDQVFMFIHSVRKN